MSDLGDNDRWEALGDGGWEDIPEDHLGCAADETAWDEETAVPKLPAWAESERGHKVARYALTERLTAERELEPGARVWALDTGMAYTVLWPSQEYAGHTCLTDSTGQAVRRPTALLTRDDPDPPMVPPIWAFVLGLMTLSVLCAAIGYWALPQVLS